MESKDVIHAFWVPEFRIKQDIIPGQPTILNFTPTKVGKYPIICAELCGPYHGGMRASIIVEEESDYNEWFNKNKKSEVNLGQYQLILKKLIMKVFNLKAGLDTLVLALIIK